MRGDHACVSVEAYLHASHRYLRLGENVLNLSFLLFNKRKLRRGPFHSIRREATIIGLKLRDGRWNAIVLHLPSIQSISLFSNSCLFLCLLAVFLFRYVSPHFTTPPLQEWNQGSIFLLSQNTNSKSLWQIQNVSKQLLSS